MTETTEGTLSTGKYNIELKGGASQIYEIDSAGNKQWVAAAVDPEKAMDIVEGLILVEMKRFHYPESKPNITTEIVEAKNVDKTEKVWF